jgi:hypothetical protein
MIKRVVRGESASSLPPVKAELLDKRKAWLEEAKKRAVETDGKLTLPEDYVEERNKQRETEGAILSKGAETLEEALVIKSLYPDAYLSMLTGTPQKILDQLAKISEQEAEDDKKVDMYESLKIKDFVLIRGKVYIAAERWYAADKRLISNIVHPKPLKYENEEFQSEEAAAQFVEEENEYNKQELKKFLGE